MSFTIIPAIDVRDGKVVRLKQGDYQRQTDYGLDPLTLSESYAEQGAHVLHLVDLDAARLGGFSLHELVQRIKKSTSLCIQAGGGIRNEQQIRTLLDAGADRVVIGTLALQEKENVAQWLKIFGSDAITLAFDVKPNAQGEWMCASHGWTELSTLSLNDIIAYYQHHAELKHVLCTDIQRDGLLTGYNVDLYQQLCTDWPCLAIQASGGVNSLTEITQVKQLGISGAILGRALLENKFTLAQALAC
jgi:phosphoribosylformimino-5-aminoimidazole carboxamide ribotide isomerase